MDKKLEKMAYFTTQDVAKLINPVSVDTLLRRELKKGTIFKLKRGFYISKEKWIELKINNETDQYLKFLTTNVLLSPSYISLEDVLFMNNVITENVYVTTAITTKKTNKFTNFLGTFSYRNIQPDLFR
ncbi:MAG: hypothetical protein LBD11_05760 [Candidatus Peribacteria bacterium]|jgi:predicted transcriptional regulator of viral defense system|nr:hypothetical protein [Candidatus Peribacteria bacterium]